MPEPSDSLAVDKAPVTTQDLSALAPEAVVMFAADCVETACYFFHGCSNSLQGELPDAVWNTIRTVRQNPGAVGTIERARDVVARSAEWIDSKSRTDERHRDSRYEGIGDETSPAEDDEYKTLYLICRAGVALAESALAAARSESPTIAAKETADLLMQASIAFAGATNYWNDDFARNCPTIAEDTRVAIRSNFAKAALRNDAPLDVVEPPR